MPALTDNDAVATLRQMVEIPSVTGSEARLAGYLRERMTTLGYRSRIDQVGNVVGEIGDPDGPTVMLLGHLDTVPGTPPVRQVGDRLYGRGTVDAKGPLAAMIHAGARTAATARVVVVGAVEEEGTSRGARHLRGSPPPDALVIGEPSGADAVVVGYKGLLSLDYRVSRPATHSSSPEEKAVEIAAEVWQEVRGRLAESPPGPLFDRANPTLVTLHGDTETAHAVISCRTPRGFDAGEFLTWLRGRCRGGEVRVREQLPAVRTSRTDPVVRALSSAIRGAGAAPVTKVKLGTSDMNVLIPRWRVPTAAYGPGDSRLDHTADEHIELGEFRHAVDVLAAAVPMIAAGVTGGRSGKES